MSTAREVPEKGRIYAGESASERLAKQRQQFMDAGLALFGTVGYRGTTVRSLCKQAGLNDRYFYKNFTGTEDLLEAVYRDIIDNLQQRLLQAISAGARGKSLTAAIPVGLDAFFTFAEDPRTARVCWLEVLGVSPRIDQLYITTTRHFASLLLTIARSFYPQWQIDEEEGLVLAQALVGALNQSALNWLLLDYHPGKQTMVSASTRLIQGVIIMVESTSPPETA